MKKYAILLLIATIILSCEDKIIEKITTEQVVLMTEFGDSIRNQDTLFVGENINKIEDLKITSSTIGRWVIKIVDSDSFYKEVREVKTFSIPSLYKVQFIPEEHKYLQTSFLIKKIGMPGFIGDSQSNEYALRIDSFYNEANEKIFNFFMITNSREFSNAEKFGFDKNSDNDFHVRLIRDPFENPKIDDFYQAELFSLNRCKYSTNYFFTSVKEINLDERYYMLFYLGNFPDPRFSFRGSYVTSFSSREMEVISY